MKLTQHPIARLLTPPMSLEHLEAYEEDILKSGQIDEVIIDDGKVLDKWHMYNVLIKHGKEVRFKDFKDLGFKGSATDYVISKMQGRKPNSGQLACMSVLWDVEENGNMTSHSRRSNACRVWHKSRREGEEYKATHLTRRDLTKVFGASKCFINYAFVIYQEDKELFNQIFKGDKFLNQSYLKHRINRPRVKPHGGGNMFQCQNNVATSKVELKIPQSFDSLEVHEKFIKDMASKGWRFEMRMVPDEKGQAKFYGQFFGNGFIDCRGYYENLCSAFSFRHLVTQAGFEKIGPNAKPKLSRAA